MGAELAFIPYGRQSVSEEDIEKVVNVLRSDYLTQGPTVPLFESAVAKYCGAQYAVATNSATSALHVACLALGVGPGDIVWTSPNTFVASANCALYCGASVDFVDIDPDTANISVERLSSKLENAQNSGRLPKVIIPVHFCGQSCDMEAISALSKKYGFRIIEDASHGIGASYKNIPVGACSFSDITVFSFHPVKIITTGEGGMALTNDQELGELLRQYRSHGITSDRTYMLPRPAEEIWNYQQIRLGYNYRMTDIHAALGLSQLDNLDAYVARRRQLAASYDAAFHTLPVVKLSQIQDSCSSYHLYPIRIRPDLCGKTQIEVYKAFWDARVAVNLHYIPVHRQPHYEAMGFRKGYCPQAEAFHREAISLPIFPSLTNEQLDYVVDILTRALS